MNDLGEPAAERWLSDPSEPGRQRMDREGELVAEVYPMSRAPGWWRWEVGSGREVESGGSARSEDGAKAAAREALAAALSEKATRMEVRHAEPNRRQYEAWLAAVSPADLARWLEMWRRHEAGEIGFHDLDFGLRDRLLRSYRPTHCDSCGKPLPLGGRPATSWGNDWREFERPTAECRTCEEIDFV